MSNGVPLAALPTDPRPTAALSPGQYAPTRHEPHRRRRLWTSLTSVLVAATALNLVVSQTYYFSGERSIDVLRWLLMGLTSAMVLFRPRSGTALRDLSMVDWVSGAFIVMAFASLLYTSHPGLTAQRTVSMVLLYVTVAWTVWHLADIIGGWRLAHLLFRTASVIIAFSALSFFATPDSMLAGRFRGVFSNPNALGLFTVIFLPISLARYLRTKTASALIITALLVGGLLLSGSRNGVLAASLGLVFMLFRMRAWRSSLVLAVTGVALYLAMPEGSEDVVSSSQAGLSRLIDTQRLSTGGGRVEAWQVAIPIIQRRLAFGHGFGTEDMIFEGLKFMIHRGAYVHNSYLGLTYQLGLVGTILFFGPLIVLLIKRAKAPRSTLQTAAYEAVLFGGLIASFFESWIYAAGNAFAFPFWIFVVLLVRVEMGVEKAEPTRRRRKPAPSIYLRPADQRSLAAPAPQRYDPPAPEGL
jgi:O-antigen ligase